MGPLFGKVERSQIKLRILSFRYIGCERHQNDGEVIGYKNSND